MLAQERKEMKKKRERKVDRVFANHSLRSTASQGTSNIPGFYINSQAQEKKCKNEQRFTNQFPKDNSREGDRSLLDVSKME
jgi:hypothetical protein